MASKPPKIFIKSKSGADRDEESIYNKINPPSGVAPIVRTYVIQPVVSPTGEQQPSAPSPTGARKMHDDSSQIQNILNPVHGPRDAQIRAGIKPPNHAKSNISAVKEQSSLNQLRKMAVQEEKSFPRGQGARSTSAPTRKPIQRQCSVEAGEGGRDFLNENKLVAGMPPIRLPRINSTKDDGLKYLHKPDFGRVPTYLLQRKIDLIDQQESEMRAREAALIPPGMRLLPEDERLETLTVLQKNRHEVERALQALPLRIETPGQIRRRDELERRLREIEEGLKVFARPKVLVKM
ncbi:hypothetical protein CEUSTIGMA_g10520.t1 [Chlamydomonas eustigma]|uniref:Enkurin domain-containing protein n=1 Tax=Chlamydomonas eustigma TaxID=1157962 RepID=A0A250XJ39_9CHLO|nr:hypothetical protein CEUSTIGMA_g10520.t1 [Chlamydomonas eustigma]|eukprot:GAX83094.1 hypothetical protein CEUSTIGMA_g10520.t1 [Chlamydomonas eustigma]